MTSSVDFPSLNHSVNSIEPMLSGNRSDPLSTSCTQRSLVEALHERGVGHSIVGWSGLSTPNNSPGCSSPDESSTHFLYETWEFLAEGAKMLRRTLTGEETPLPPARCLLPRIARRELEVLIIDILLECNVLEFFLILDRLANAFAGQVGETGSRRSEPIMLVCVSHNFKGGFRKFDVRK